MSIVDELRSDCRQGRAVLVVGAGVTASSTTDKRASWTGLLESGRDHALEVNRSLPHQWKQAIDLDIEMGNAMPSALISAAEKITEALGGAQHGEFREWLQRSFNDLKIEDESTVRALGDLGLPILTTNYDHLLETVLGRSTSTWREAAQMQAVIQSRSTSIGHLHGSFHDPVSIIFGGQSYGMVLGDEAAQALQQAIAFTHSLVFVGFGAGLADPNFAGLRNWLTQVLGTSGARHYRLCREREMSGLSQEHSAERIVPVAYGPDYGDLATFVRSLCLLETSSVGADRLPARYLDAPIKARTSLEERVRGESVLGEHVHDLDQRAHSELLIPPVLLPVTHEQFVRSQELPKGERLRRFDAMDDARRQTCLLLVGEERVGLTTALEWLVMENQSAGKSTTPLVIDFRDLGAGKTPLRRQIVKELRLAGMDVSPKEQLPRLALALDNVSVRPEKILERLFSELHELDLTFTVFGCRQGAEAALSEFLEAADLRPALRYVGRLNTRDIRQLAALVSPARARILTDRAVQIISREHLPRTPFTVSLLLSALLHGEGLLATASQTALLDAYVHLLLGRGDPHDDARFALDSLERADILATIADHMVTKQAGSLTESEILSILDSYFDALGWDEDPFEVLSSLRDRHLLTLRGGQVQFAQASYLHLFAAKRAVTDTEFRMRLFLDPLYYAPIIGHYAALTRNDPDALATVERLLWASGEVDLAEVGNFAKLYDSDPVSEASSVDDLVRKLDLPRPEKPSQTEGHDANPDWLDRIEDSDQTPFPLDRPEDTPPAMQLSNVLSLVSNVLRDSELVRDLDLKQRVLARTLILYGRFVQLLEQEESYRDFVRSLAEEVSDGLGLGKNRRDEFIEELIDLSAMLTAFGGMASNLSSRKLARSLSKCFEDDGFLGVAPGTIMGALLAFQLQDRGWAQRFVAAGRRHRDVKSVLTVLKPLAFAAYYHHTLHQDDAETLHNFLVDLTLRDAKVNEAAKKDARARISQKLNLNRSRYASRRHPIGQTIFTDSGRIPDTVEGEVLEEEILEIGAGSKPGNS